MATIRTEALPAVGYRFWRCEGNGQQSGGEDVQAAGWGCGTGAVSRRTGRARGKAAPPRALRNVGQLRSSGEAERKRAGFSSG